MYSDDYAIPALLRKLVVYGIDGIGYCYRHRPIVLGDDMQIYQLS